MNEFPNSNLSNASALNTDDHKYQIGRIWNLLRPDHTQPLELRALHPSKGSSAKVRHFRPNAYESPETNRAAFEDDALELNAQGYNVYTPLNPIKHDFYGKSVRDSDILCRRLLLIDIDRVSDTKRPATGQEIKSAENLAEDVTAFLSQKGWPNPARMMSGNGFHLYFPLDDLPNTEQVTGLVKATLKELSRRFDTDAVGVDTSVFNASRITKVPGTIMRKGEATEDRPHRMAKLLSEFATTRVTESMLTEIVALGDTILNAPLEAPRELVGPDFSVAITIIQLKSALSSISSHTPRGNGSIDLIDLKDYWLGVVWAIAGLNLAEGKEIAREWSAQSSLYTHDGFEAAWESFDPSHPNPIGIGSVLRLEDRLSNNGFAPLLYPLPEAGRLAAFPERCVPPSLRPWLADITYRLDIPLEYVAAASLVAASSIIGRRAAVRPKVNDPWDEHATLWGLVVAQPGELKSPSIAMALKPIEALEHKERDKWKQAEIELRKKRAVLSERESVARSQLKNAIKNADGTEALAEKVLGETHADLIKIEHKLAQGGRRFICNDATTEKLAELCQANPYGLMLSRDELSGWFEMLTKAGREGDRQFFLEAWTGASGHSYDRIGRGSPYIPHICLSLFGTIQPGKLKYFVTSAGQDGGEADGLLQRFQILLFPDSRGPRKFIDESPNKEAQENYQNVFDNLAALKWQSLFSLKNGIALDGPEGSPYYYFHFEDEAQSRANEWFIELEAQIDLINVDAFKALMGKYRGLMPRLALNYFLIEVSAERITTQKIPLEAVEFAIEWCKHLEAHARKLWAPNINPALMPAKALAKRILEGTVEDRTSLSQIQQKNWSKLTKVKDVKLGVNQLEKWGWLKQEVLETQGAPSTIILLNPELPL